MKNMTSRADDSAEFEALMRQHNRMLFRTARAILHDDADAEDALQDAYVKAFGAMGSFRGEAKVSTWLARIVANEALQRLRKSKRRDTIVPLRSSAGHEEITEIAEGNMSKGPEQSAG